MLLKGLKNIIFYLFFHFFKLHCSPIIFFYQQTYQLGWYIQGCCIISKLYCFISKRAWYIIQETCAHKGHNYNWHRKNHLNWKKLSLYCINLLLLWLLLWLNDMPESNFQILPSSLELLFMDFWWETETLHSSNACSSSVCYFFYFSSAFLTCFCIMIFTSCLVKLFIFQSVFLSSILLMWNADVSPKLIK